MGPASEACAEHEPALHDCPTLAQSRHVAPPVPHVPVDWPPTHAPFASQQPPQVAAPHTGLASSPPSPLVASGSASPGPPSSNVPPSLASAAWPVPSGSASTLASLASPSSITSRIASSLCPTGASTDE